jgi:hypothetical protein
VSARSNIGLDEGQKRADRLILVLGPSAPHNDLVIPYLEGQLAACVDSQNLSN